MIQQVQDVYTLPSIINLDNLFTTTPNTLVLNGLLLEKSSDEIIEIICDVAADRDDSVAVCPCENLSGNYYEGVRCPACGQICTADLFNQIRNDTWLAIPNSIVKVLNPQVYIILSKWLGNIARIPILTSVVDMNQPVMPIPGTPFFTGQGFNWLYNNFDMFINHFINSHPTKSRRDSGPNIRAFLSKTGDAIWCTKLPILSRMVQPITRHSDTVRYADPELKTLMKAIFTLGSTLISEKMMKFSIDHVERNFHAVYASFLEYTTNILTYKLAKKPSVLRKHVFGTRYHMTGRSVVIAMMGNHEADEVYLPWKLGIMMYKYHIISVLINHHGMTVVDANNRVMTALKIYDHTIDLIMQKLITDCPTKGLPILLNRNPSLKLAAIQQLYVTKIKPALTVSPTSTIVRNSSGSIHQIDDSILQFNDDGFAGGYRMDDDLTDQKDEVNDNEPNLEVLERITRRIEDETIEVSPLIIRGPNIDFDGDEINLMVLCEQGEIPKFHNIHPYHRLLSSSEVAINGQDVSISNQQLVVLSAWLNHQEV